MKGYQVIVPERLNMWQLKGAFTVMWERNFFRAVKNYPWSHRLEKLLSHSHWVILVHASIQYSFIHWDLLAFIYAQLFPGHTTVSEPGWGLLLPSFTQMCPLIWLFLTPYWLQGTQVSWLKNKPKSWSLHHCAWQLAWDVCAMLAYSDATLKKVVFSLQHFKTNHNFSVFFSLCCHAM